jgi:hypothetical protein
MRFEQTDYGLVANGDGWYVLNMREAEWRHADGRGAVCVVLDEFEGERRDVSFGVNPFVLQPGEAMAIYHWEADQEAFLVVAGEATLIVEGEERPLRAGLRALPAEDEARDRRCRKRPLRRDRDRRAVA